MIAPALSDEVVLVSPSLSAENALLLRRLFEREAQREVHLKERGEERERRGEEAAAAAVDLYDPWHAVYGYPLSLAGHSHWHHDPALAFMYATSLGFLGMGYACDLFLVTFFLCCSPPHKATWRYMVARTCLVLFYSFLTSTLAAVVFPLVFRVDAAIFRHCGAIFAFYVAGDYGLLTCALLVAGSCAFVFTDSSPSAAFGDYNPFFHLWFAARVKNCFFAPVLASIFPTEIYSLNRTWENPRGRDVAFHKKYSESFYRMTTILLYAQMGALLWMYRNVEGFNVATVNAQVIVAFQEALLRV